MSNTYLAHYGVPGMKWGVWNAETQRKYDSDRYYDVLSTNKHAKKAISSSRDYAINSSDAKKSQRASDRYAKRAGKARSKGKERKAERLTRKSEKRADEASKSRIRAEKDLRTAVREYHKAGKETGAPLSAVSDYLNTVSFYNEGDWGSVEIATGRVRVKQSLLSYKAERIRY